MIIARTSIDTLYYEAREGEGEANVASEDTRSQSKVDRRTAIKRALTAGGVGYVAPLILGTATPASAQVVSGPCSPQGCGELCGPTQSCACIGVVGGGSACVEPVCISSCTTSADCGVNQVCMSTDCCGGTTCVALCGSLNGIESAAARSSSGWQQ